MSHCPNSLKGVMSGMIYGTTVGVINGGTASLDPKPYIIGLIKGYTRSLDYKP